MPFKLNPTTNKLDYYNNDAIDVNYDNTTSGLIATDVQTAIDIIGNGLNYVKNQFNVFTPLYSGSSTNSFTKDVFHGTIVRIKNDITIDQSQARVSITSTGTGIIGIYKYNIQLNTWSKVVQINGINLAVSGDQVLTYPSSVNLTSGIYATGFLLENTTTMGSIGVGFMEHIFMTSGLGGTSYINKMQFNHIYNGTLPNNPTVTLGPTSVNNALTSHRII